MLNRTLNLFLIPGYPFFLTCMLLQGMAISISSLFLAVYFTTRLGVTAGIYGVFTAVTIISGVWLSMRIAKRSDSGLNRKKLIVTAMLFNTIAFAGYLFITAFTAVGAPAMPQLFASAFLLAFFVAVISAIGISCIQDLLPDLPGYASTLYTSSTTLGRLFGSLAGGAAAQWFGYRNAYWTCLLLIVSPGLLALPRHMSSGKATRSPGIT
ncbi:MFS transporter [Paenibacillus sp. S150]|uniref:MFS transporter n=1 Tax=Paenibacillus sp. S150 TaxID=2749826 RepID=UPI001C5A3BB5|nr:MFS transporter [Paenibacillus sp. S150]MBW4085798.1 MFS transporter [Paenibacillus sp. S150]